MLTVGLLHHPILVMDLTSLYFAYNSGHYCVGWAAFSRLLCDPSSINNTYLSNHTLENLGGYYNQSGIPRNILEYLEWNRDQNHPAIRKILQNHSDFDMEPFFQWKLKFLSLVVTWFAKARLICQGNMEEFQGRELSRVSICPRMPMLALGRHQIQQKTNRRSRKRGLDGEAK